MISPQDHILIKRFVGGTLTGAELKEFQERMTADSAFRSEVDFYSLLFSGISLSREQELTDFIVSNVPVKQYTPRSVIAIVIVMLIIIASGVGVWNYLEKDASTSNKDFFINNIFTRKQMPGSSDKQKQERKSVAKQSSVEKETAAENDVAQVSAKNDSALSTQSATLDSSAADEKIIIKKDELISSVELAVIDKTHDQKPEDQKGKESLTKEAVEKLNPGAQLPEEENSHLNSLQVEFWQSPVNYKGFKLVKNKLVLFGIDRPEAVKLFSLNDQLYMQYGQTISKLNQTYDYQSFLVLKESEIPSQLK